jgi:ABC-type ATPase with predicted acetyltransferase domain
MQLSVAYDFLPRHGSVRAAQVMDHFGIGLEQGRHVVAEGLPVPIDPCQVVLFTGPSGSGKSSLMRAAAEHLRATQAVIVLDSLELPQSLLIDALDLPAEQAMSLLASCGLGEAHLMLRTPDELSDGQRYRFRLAYALSRNPTWIVADEFSANLDRTLARVIAFNVRRLADRTGTGFLLATTHEDIAADLTPDVHVRCRLDGDAVVESRAAGATPDNLTSKKKEPSRSRATSGFPPRPVATGRTSLGGITAVITSG